MLVSLWNGEESGFLLDYLRIIWLEETIEVRSFSNKQEKGKQQNQQKPMRNPVGNTTSLMCARFKDLPKILENFYSSILYITLKKTICMF